MLIEKIKKLLSSIEQKVNLERKIQGIKKNIRTEESNLLNLQHQLDELEGAVKEEKKYIFELELDINSLADQEKIIKSKLYTLSKHKEIESASKEILNLQQRREALEEELLNCLNDIERFENRLKDEAPALSESMNEIREKINLLQGEIIVVEQELKPLFLLIDQASSDLPGEFKQRYKRALEKLERPVVPVQDSNCSACYFFITPQKMAEFKKNKVGDCTNCGRILFFNDNV